MAGTQIQRLDALMQAVPQADAAGIPGGRAAKQGTGEFEEMVRQAGEILEAARSAVIQAGSATAQQKPDSGADTDITAIGSTQKQSPVRDAATKPKENNQNNKENTISQDDKKDARVTDDNAKQVENLKEHADDAGRQVISEVAEKLDLTEADVEAAMEILGLEAFQLLDPVNLTALITELSGESDPMTLVTDADLYATLQDLLQTARQIGEEAQIAPEDVQFITEQIELQPEEVPEEIEAAPVTPFTEALEAAENEQPVRVSRTETDSEGNTVTVEVTMEEGSEVARQAVQAPAAQENGQEQDPAGGQNRGGNRREGIRPDQMADQVVNELAGRMADSNVEFTDVMQAQETARTDTTQMVEIVRQITEQIRVNFAADMTSMELTLHPASLGNVQLTVLQDATGRMVAQFAVENETVRQAIESQISTLQQRLDEQGTRIEAVEVTLASHGFESNLSGGSGRNASEEEREAQMTAQGPRGTRRIDLSQLTDPEELEDEQRIAAEMMAANGGTVDYTA